MSAKTEPAVQKIQDAISDITASLTDEEYLEVLDEVASHCELLADVKRMEMRDEPEAL